MVKTNDTWNATCRASRRRSKRTISSVVAIQSISTQCSRRLMKLQLNSQICLAANGITLQFKYSRALIELEFRPTLVEIQLWSSYLFKLLSKISMPKLYNCNCNRFPSNPCSLIIILMAYAQ